MAESTLREYIESQEDLVREAGLALPHQFAHCTHALGYIRQAVYLCTTCPEQRGICSACSIACHTDHEQVELFPKRDFRCDCATDAIAHRCALETTVHPANQENVYGQNFRGVFCRCSRPYDAQKEREAMIQCLTCEDWFHESCCNLRERPSSREPTPNAPELEPTVDDDAASEAESYSGLPPPLISASDYDSFVCGSCVRGIPILKKYAGSPGAIIVVRDSPEDAFKRIGLVEASNEDEDVAVEDEDVPAGTKRKLSPNLADAREAKRARRPSSTCLAPTPSTLASKVYENGELGTGDLFLTEGFRERWCRCEECRVSLESHRYLLEEEETYEPPEDPDSGLSLEELGMRALSRLPRDRAIDGIQAFNKMRDGLKSFLQPFAEEGKVVNEGDVKDFFEAFAESVKKGRG